MGRGRSRGRVWVGHTLDVEVGVPIVLGKDWADIAISVGVYRVAGSAQAAGGAEAVWTMVLKVVRSPVGLTDDHLGRPGRCWPTAAGSSPASAGCRPRAATGSTTPATATPGCGSRTWATGPPTAGRWTTTAP